MPSSRRGSTGAARLPAAGYATWLVLIAGYGVMYGMLPWLGQRLGLGTRPGLVAGLVGALQPRLPGYVEAPAAVAIGLMRVTSRPCDSLPPLSS